MASAEEGSRDERFGGVFLTWAFLRSAVDLADPANSYSGIAWFGVSVPLAITIMSFLLGLVLMVIWRVRSPAFFRNRPEVLPAGTTVPPAATATL
jgi:hypothetical protein